ncbi:MAG: hypothetical protein M3N07_03915 [Pseudomonadota bacterium]|nr:hypothetical protein [Pseudomonadota bacterium]
MPDPLTLGHLLTLAAALAALYALWQLAVWAGNRGHGRGTPQYARARDGRRYALWGFAAALLLVALGRLTPLGDMALGR